jgi:hypothetical protein
VGWYKAITGAWPLPDPAKFSGSPAERSTLLNELYASLHRRLGIRLLPMWSKRVAPSRLVHLRKKRQDGDIGARRRAGI